MNRRWVRVLLRLLLAALALPAALWLALNLALNLGVERLVSPQPERVQVRWTVAWMWWPGRVEVRGLEVRAQSEVDQLFLHADHARGRLNLRALGARQLSFDSTTAAGVAFYYRGRKPDPLDGAPPLAAPENDISAPIPGLTNPPYPNPERIYGPPAAALAIHFGDLEVRRIRELWIEDYHFVGHAEARGGFGVQPGMSVGVLPTEITLISGQLLLGEDPVLTDLRGTVHLALTPFVPAEAPGATAFGKVTAEAALRAHVRSLRFLGFYLKAAPWLSVGGGEGDFTLRAQVERGVVLPGAALEVAARNIEAQLFGYQVEGDGSVRMAVDAPEGVPRSTVHVRFGDYALRATGSEVAHIEGSGLTVTAESPDTALHEPFTRADLEVLIPESRIPDLRVYDRYIPPGAGVSLLGGHGLVRGRLQLASDTSAGRGELALDVPSAWARMGKLDIRGDAALAAVIPIANVRDGDYDLSGTELSLTNVEITDRDPRRPRPAAPGWWASLRVEEGRASTASAELLDAGLRLQMRDTAPLLQLAAEAETMPGWLRDALSVKGVNGTARLRFEADAISVSDLSLAAGGFRVQLDLLSRGERVRARVLASLGMLSAGIGVNDATVNVQLLSPKKWYAEHPIAP